MNVHQIAIRHNPGTLVTQTQGLRQLGQRELRVIGLDEADAATILRRVIYLVLNAGLQLYSGLVVPSVAAVPLTVAEDLEDDGQTPCWRLNWRARAARPRTNHLRWTGCGLRAVPSFGPHGRSG